MMMGRIILSIAVSSACISLSGCEMFEETDLDPFESQDAYFTVYGYLDATRTEQEIRVIPVRRTPEVILSPTDENAFIDASVTSTDIELGTVVQWRHVLVQLSDDTYGHVFRTTLLPRPGRAYRVDIVRSDGKTTGATTVIPVLSSISQPVSGEVRYQPGLIQRDITLPGVTYAASIDVYYDVTDGALSHVFRVIKPYSGAGAPDGNGGWRFTLDLTRDAHDVRLAAEPALGETISWNGMGIRVRWVDTEWPLVDGPVDIDVLGQPGGPTNVENGFGFIGAVGDYLRFWDVEDDDLKAELGFN